MNNAVFGTNEFNCNLCCCKECELKDSNEKEDDNKKCDRCKECSGVVNFCSSRIIKN